MDKFSVDWQGQSWGKMAVCEEGLYTRFCVRCCLPEEGLWCVWIIGTNRDLRLGVLEPCKKEAEISRCFSGAMTRPLGQILRGELRRVDEAAGRNWRAGTTGQIKTPWIHRQLAGRSDWLIWSGETGKKVALPYLTNQAFPLVPLFCFAKIQQIDGKWYAVFALDREESPVFEIS